jgi:hypothetical protein
VNKPNLFQEPKLAYLDKARAKARELLERRETITVEDVTILCPLPRYLHRNNIGLILKHPDFRPIGYTIARRPSSNGRVIRIWGLSNPQLKKWVSRVERDAGD